MQEDFTIFSATTGEVVRVGNCPAEDVELQAGSNEVVVIGNYPHTDYYLLNGAVTLRPSNPASYSNLLFTNVPQGSQLIIDEATYTVSGTVEVVLPSSQYYDMELHSWPFKTLRVGSDI